MSTDEKVPGPTLINVVRIRSDPSRPVKKTPVACEAESTVGDIKKSYLAESPFRDFIDLALEHDGRLLRNDETLRGIPQGAWLTYKTVTMTPEHKARPLSQRAAVPPPLNLDAAPSPDFIADPRGVFKADRARALVPSPGKRPQQQQQPKWKNVERTLPGRDLICSYSMSVNNCIFQTIHRLEGQWSGDAIRVQSKEQAACTEAPASSVSISRVNLVFDDAARVWHERRTLTDKNGYTTTSNFVLKPVSDGLLQVAQSGLDSRTFRMEERPHNVILFTGCDADSGRLRFVETITLLSATNRVRTTQVFDRDGKFLHTFSVDESRVIGALDGAMEPFEDN